MMSALCDLDSLKLTLGLKQPLLQGKAKAQPFFVNFFNPLAHVMSNSKAAEGSFGRKK